MDDSLALHDIGDSPGKCIVASRVEIAGQYRIVDFQAVMSLDDKFHCDQLPEPRQHAR